MNSPKHGESIVSLRRGLVSPNSSGNKYSSFGNFQPWFKSQKEEKFLLTTYETWRMQRVRTIAMLKSCADSIANVTEKTSIGKFILSNASILGSAAFLVTDYLDVIPEWRTKLLMASGVLGTMSFLCDVMLQYYSKSNIEKMIDVALLDQDKFDAMSSDKQHKLFFNLIEKSFPCGILDDVLKDILASHVEISGKLQFKIKEIERRYQNLNSQSRKEFGLSGRPRIVVPKSHLRFNNYDSTSLQEMMNHLKMIEEDKMFHKSATDAGKIFSVIYLSNVIQKRDLLYDAEFIKKVKIFSKSEIANFWWKNLENKKSAKQAEKKKLYAEMNSALKIDKLFWPVVSVAILPLIGDPTASALAIVITSGIIAFDAFCELTIKIQPKETRILKRLHRILSSEYEDLKLGESFNENYQIE